MGFCTNLILFLYLLILAIAYNCFELIADELKKSVFTLKKLALSLCVVLMVLLIIYLI